MENIRCGFHFHTDLGEDADAALHGDLGEEEVVGEEALPEAAELEQPAEDGRLLEIGEPAHDLAGEAPAVHGRGHVGRAALELLPQLRQHEQRLPPVYRRVVAVSALVLVLVLVSSPSAARGEVVIPAAAGADVAAAARGGEREGREAGPGEAEGG